MNRFFKTSFMSLVYAFLYIPIIILIVNSFNANRFGMSWKGFTTKWYELLPAMIAIQAALNSLTIAVVSATATLIGSLTGALYRYRFRGKIRQ